MNKFVSGDEVVVIAGKDLGKVGKIISVFPKTSMLVVDGVNLKKKHIKKNKDDGEGENTGLKEFFAPIHWSNVMHFCSETKSPSRIFYGFDEDGSTKLRFYKKTGTKV